MTNPYDVAHARSLKERGIPTVIDPGQGLPLFERDELIELIDGATLLFPTSFGYFDPHMLAVAAKNEKVRFAHCGGMWTQGKHPMNTGSYFGYIDEGQYLNGVVAGHASSFIACRRNARSAPGSAELSSMTSWNWERPRASVQRSRKAVSRSRI